MKHLDSLTKVAVLCMAGLAFASSDCALTSKADLVDIRYFSPERVKPHSDVAVSAAAKSDRNLEVRLGRVSSGPNLRERIAYRDTAYELGYYEELRWTERPETFVRRELGRSLFEAHGMRRALDRAAPTLDVEVIAFDEIRLKTGRAVQVQMKVILYDDAGVVFEDTMTIERPVVGALPKIEDVVAAMATALDAATEQVSLKVQTALAARRPSTQTASSP
ncbi:MAG: membrane integrity-associated transporter subunit PqiC [Deltaproteobacteria bacterium]|nr:membrane integrity-associated transporter subunit PqiC [Deltaproteobacteria bacterium]